MINVPKKCDISAEEWKRLTHLAVKYIDEYGDGKDSEKCPLFDKNGELNYEEVLIMESIIKKLDILLPD